MNEPQSKMQMNDSNKQCNYIALCKWPANKTRGPSASRLSQLIYANYKNSIGSFQDGKLLSAYNVKATLIDLWPTLIVIEWWCIQCSANTMQMEKEQKIYIKLVNIPRSFITSTAAGKKSVYSTVRKVSSVWYALFSHGTCFFSHIKRIASPLKRALANKKKRRKLQPLKLLPRVSNTKIKTTKSNGLCWRISY